MCTRRCHGLGTDFRNGAYQQIQVATDLQDVVEIESSLTRRP